MAAEVVRKKQTGSAAAATLAITAPAKGNLLVAFVSQTGSATAPTGKDNIGGVWSTNATKGQGALSTANVWVMTKVAEGGEVTLEPTVGVGGTIQGISYFEVSGATATVDAIVHTDNPGSVKTVTSPSTTSTVAGDVILAGVGGAASPTGTITAWTGTGPELANTETTSTRCMGGSAVVAGLVEGKTFTANWTNSVNYGLLVVALKAEAGGKTTVEQAVLLSAGSTGAVAAKKVGTQALAVAGGSRATVAAVKVAASAMSTLAGARTITVAQRAVQSAVAITTGASIASVRQKIATSSLQVQTGSTLASAAKLVATGTVSLRTGSRVTLTTGGQHVFEAAVAIVAGGRMVPQAVKVATAGAVVRAGARQVLVAQRAATGSVTMRAGAVMSSSARRVAVSSVVVSAGARVAVGSRVSIAGVVSMRSGARLIVRVEEPAPVGAKFGAAAVGIGYGAQTGVDLGPTTGDSR